MAIKLLKLIYSFYLCIQINQLNYGNYKTILKN